MDVPSGFANKWRRNRFSVEGEVEFSPADGSTYVVRGELKKEGSSVWIEESETKQRVAEVVAETK